GRVVAQQPAHVGVREAAELPGYAAAVAVGRMRVTGPVGEGVVAAVDGDPADDLTLEAHRPRDRQRDAQRRDRGEAAMSQQSGRPRSDETLVDVAPSPPRSRLEAGGYRVVGFFVVRPGMLT